MSNNNFDLSNESVEWYTPTDIINASKAVLTNGIEVDCASCAYADSFIHAAFYFSEHVSYLQYSVNSFIVNRPSVSCFCNPPSRKIRMKKYGTWSEASAFWRKLLEEYQEGRILDAVYVGVSSKLIHINPEMLDYPMCITNRYATANSVNSSGRIKFKTSTGKHTSPTQGNMMILLPNKERESEQTLLFGQLFREFGSVGIFCEIG